MSSFINKIIVVTMYIITILLFAVMAITLYLTFAESLWFGLVSVISGAIMLTIMEFIDDNF